MLERLKRACRISAGTDKFDDYLLELQASAMADLGIAGVSHADGEDDPMIQQAVVLYVSAYFPAQPDPKMIQIYEAFRTRLQMATNYTDWVGDA